MSIKLPEIYTQQSIPSAVADSFEQITTAVHIERMGNGLINSTWKIAGADGSYILQKVNDQVFRDPFIIEHNLKKIAEHIRLHYPAYALPLPLKNREGKELLYVAGNGYFRMFHFLEDSVCNTVVNNSKQAFEAARQFAGFARRLNALDTKELGNPIEDFHNLTLRYQHFETAVTTAQPSRLMAAKELINFLQEHSGIVTQFQNMVKSGSMLLRPMHHDTKISNVLFDQQDRGLAVIDLDTVMPGYFISDLGDMIRTFTCTANEEETDFNKVTIREDFFEAIINGYLSEMKDILTASERNLLVYAGEFMIYMQCLRFATDYLENDRYYGAKYPDHNLNRALNQKKLLEELIQAKPVLEKIIEAVFQRIK
ncbi:aminoglycoside phosphotransferase family protein [Sediminibacterium sp.]|uniref:phosphotransferase enzyme family protein n=1 Tax=Sediminibacterium sp. TaxID=1917865 RepID=UPI0025E5F56B|nr:aminoglycoside phosphotransferase family protein [Sediminibacterium sp.]MBW0176808.1 aminoglycoside phosphotransferase family protein [Sediminibacterium sp.]